MQLFIGACKPMPYEKDEIIDVLDLAMSMETTSEHWRDLKIEKTAKPAPKRYALRTDDGRFWNTKINRWDAANFRDYHFGFSVDPTLMVKKDKILERWRYYEIKRLARLAMKDKTQVIQQLPELTLVVFEVIKNDEVSPFSIRPEELLQEKARYIDETLADAMRGATANGAKLTKFKHAIKRKGGKKEDILYKIPTAYCHGWVVFVMEDVDAVHLRLLLGSKMTASWTLADI